MNKKILFLVIVFICLILSILFSLNIGATHINLWALVSSSAHQALNREVVLSIRAPRVVMGVLAGAALGGAGAIMQGLFRNPLADPSLIGVSSGAGLITSFLIVCGIPDLFPPAYGAWSLPLGGMIGGFGATALLYLFARRQGETSISTILLAGVAFSAFCGALTGILVFRANDQALRDITFWTMGSLVGVNWFRVLLVLPFFGISLLCTAGLAQPLNAMLLGEADASLMGFPVERTKQFAMLACAASVGASVSLVGSIGFIGVVVPHLVRLVTGPDYRWVLPGSVIMGAMLLVLSDSLARIVAAPAEVPVGIITAILGAPVFVWLLVRTHKGSSVS
ncbi:iron ABC transporter [Acetobacter senegalensis]|uniref:Iron ABC transporter n=2 Tax=Acetobacter TaxID=434 RepID=A0A149U6D5_9PROT|nr:MULTISPECIES: iron ABC transporter permease [Acetobacter]KXV61054.1 iron ABC transporter [Acetobacter senegalensis]MCG4273190.1 iron ABC transporter permease [Acetobacter senegalensis]MCP1197372.1 iron ABC transporter permease [Acetobacter senegalensis]MDN7356195.1 iron ABC transporter permease [Acetobacter senegalensis]GAA08776.1 ferrichrome Fe3+-siderophore transporter permease protein FecCD [Acetobacter tropicalis NBRC 101654]